MDAVDAAEDAGDGEDDGDGEDELLEAAGA